MIINKITTLPRNAKTAILIVSDTVFLILAILLYIKFPIALVIIGYIM